MPDPRSGKCSFLSGNLGQNILQKITINRWKITKLSFVTVLMCCRVQQYVFKTDKTNKINLEVFIVVTVLQD